MQKTSDHRVKLWLRLLYLLAAPLLAVVMLVAWMSGVPLVYPAHASPGVLYVDRATGGDTPTCGTTTTPCKSISYTLNTRASSGDTIRVAQGTYTENLTIGISVTLEGGFESTTWTRNITLYESILDGSGNPAIWGDWDESHIGSPIVVSNGITLEMWYNGNDLNGVIQLGRATSTDKVTWAKDPGNPLFGSGAPGDWDEGNVWEPFILFDSGTYEMWYSANGNAIGYATSTDGINWNRHPNPVLEAGPGGTWDENGVSDPYVIKASGTYTMWYESWTGTGRLGCATSADGVNWTKCASNPVLEPGDPGDWDEAAVHDPVVVLRDGTYHLWYRGSGPDWTWHIGYVTSTNGITFPRSLTAPVLSGTGGEWDDGSLELGDVIFDGATYHLWYGSNSQFGYATSPDGINWTKHASNPILTTGTPTQWGEPVIHVTNSNVKLVLDGLTITGGSGAMAGGVHGENADVTLRNCLVRGNRANGGPDSQGAGGVLGGIGGGQVTIVDSRIMNNHVIEGAGGVRVHQGTLVISNTLVADNLGDVGIHVNGPLSLTNVTLANNEGGVTFNPPAGVVMSTINSIIYGNNWSVWTNQGVIQISYSDIEGGWPGTGNIDSVPIFVNSANGDYHLSAWSPAVDAGTPVGAPPNDIEGTPRDAIPDMGAYEFTGTPASPVFDGVAAAASVDDMGDGLGVAWGDYDGNGFVDLYVAQGGMIGGETDILYANQGNGTFVNASGPAGMGDAGATFGATWGDYDNDGDLDLYVTRYNQSNLLYANNGDGTFTEVSAAAGVDNAGDSTSAAWVDYDIDGLLDLFVVGEWSANALYRNNGDGTFSDVATAAGLADGGWQREEGVAWGDYNNDGMPDLYIANDGPNPLYRNNGDGTFTEVGGLSGVADPRFSRGAAWGDFDNDGDLDLYVTNYLDESALYRNDGGTFTDVSAAAGVNDPGGGIGVTLGDYDNDGYLDIFIVNSGPNALYLNNGDGTFTQHPGLTHDGNAHGVASADYDNDGDLDVYVTNREDGNPNLLYRNRGNANHWLHVRLVGSHSNADGIGARVRVVSGGMSQIREVNGGSGFASQDSLPAEFGLGTQGNTVTLEVTWPSGVVDTLTGIAVDQVVTVTESTPPLHDMAVVNVSPGGEVSVDVPFDVQATLRNVGFQTESRVPLTCEIEYTGAPVYNQAQVSGDILPSAWTVLNFPAYTPTQEGEYTLTCWHTLAGDENPANDVYSRTLTAVPHPPDVWTKDNPDDTGEVPSDLSNWYESPDLWVRNNPDGGLLHQDPIQGVTNTVYVRLRNRGATPVISGTVDVYWIEPSLGVRCGDWAHIGTIPFNNLLPGETRIVSTSWVPSRAGHTCLQDVVDSPQDPYNRGLECSPLWVPWDNNVEWHNVNIIENPSVGLNGALDIQQASVQLVNIYDQPKDVDLVVKRLTFPTTGTITVKLPAGLFDRWLSSADHWGAGIEVLTNTREIRITGEVSATIGAIPMLAAEEVSVNLTFEGPAGLSFKTTFQERIDDITVGGVTYQWVIPDTTPPAVDLVSPGDSATEVAGDAPLVITFDEPVSPINFSLTVAPDPGGWMYYWNDDSTVVTATHTTFSPGTTYVARVIAQDGSANLMSQAYQWEFTTQIAVIYLPLIIR